MQCVKMWCYYIIGILYLTTLTSGDQPKIVIIGAGASGIAAASRLFENGFQNITIIEAENRIGGRVHTVWFDDGWVEAGGEWVHGQTNNIVYELASPFGVLEVPQETEGTPVFFYNSNGDLIPEFISNNLFEYYSYISEQRDFSVNNGSIGDYLTAMLTAEAKKYPTVNDTLVRQFLKLFEGASMGSDAANNWHEVSLKGYQESHACPGSYTVTWKARGYQTLFDILMKKYPNPEEELPVLNNTILNTEVVNIDYNSTEGKALVVTSNGQQYIADHVIFTPSLGVLKKQYETLFTPQLPEYKVKTIKGLGFGTIAKIYLTFEEPWWPHDATLFGYMWDENKRQEYENDPSKKWLVNVFGSSLVVGHPRILCSWLSGASAEYMETLPEAQVLNQTFALLNKFLGKSYNITEPTGILRSQWHSNKHFRGTYSYRSMESERADVWADQLAAPLLVNNKPILLFAGEATHAHYYGNVHAGVETGFREANRLIEIYKNSTK